MRRILTKKGSIIYPVNCSLETEKMARGDTTHGTSAGTRDKRAKFVALAEGRTAAAIKAIRTIGKLGNQSHYEYTEADVRKIAAALTKEIDAMKTRMLSRGGKETIEFKL
jgi:hypothetical protein